jgi:hypothetical protein
VRQFAVYCTIAASDDSKNDPREDSPLRIVDIRETAIPLNSSLANSSFDFSEMTTSVVVVLTDVERDGKPVCGVAFNSTGRYACGVADADALYSVHS